MNKATLKKNFPFTVTLGFASEEQKAAFLGQFSDGWGENLVMFSWDHEKESLDKTDFIAIEWFDNGQD